MLESYNDDVLTKLCHVIFLAWTAWNIFYIGAWLHPEWLKKWAQKHTTTFFNTHGLVVQLAVFFCAGDWWFAYLGGILLVTSLFCLLTEIASQVKSSPFSYNTLKTLFLLDCHHLGPIVALYFQPPEDCWLNALFFGHVWWIHGKGKYYDPYVKPHLAKVVRAVLDLDLEDNRASEKCYAVITALLYALYISYFPLGFNYTTAAVLLQFTGRCLINDNYLNVDWIKTIELPGVIAVTLWQFGPAPVIFAYLFYKLHVHYRTREKGLNFPKKFVMTDEIRKFMAEFPRKEQDAAENEGKATWFDGQVENDPEWKKYEFFKHCMLGNEEEVKRFLDEGTDPNMVHKLWHNSKPLAWAVASDQIAIMCLLIEAGVFPFDSEARKTAKQFNAKKATKFFEELAPLTYAGLRAELNVSHERVEAPGLTHKMSVELAKEKGGRLLTNDEIQIFLMETSLLPKEDQWVATFTKDGEPDWVQVGDKYWKAGLCHLERFGCAPCWGDNLEDKTHGTPTWQRILVWKKDATEDAKDKNDAKEPVKAPVCQADAEKTVG